MKDNRLYAIINKYQLAEEDEVLRILQDGITTDVIMLHLNAPYKICIVENGEYMQIARMLFTADAVCGNLYNTVYPDVYGYYKSASPCDTGVIYNPSDTILCYTFTLYDFIKFARRVFSEGLTIDDLRYKTGSTKCYVELFEECYLMEQLDNFSIKITKIC